MKVGRIEFSPGPWRKGDHPFDIVTDEYHVVATVAHDRQGLNRGREESLANARLIAAAPDLLAALKAVLAGRRELWGDDVREGILELAIEEDALFAADAAIAKAEAGAL